MRANTAATLGVICGASSITNGTGSRLDADDGSVSMVPPRSSPGGGSAAPLFDDVVISFGDFETRTSSDMAVHQPLHLALPPL